VSCAILIFCGFFKVSSLHTSGHTRPLELTWTSDQLVAEAATYKTKAIEHPFPLRGSNPKSEQTYALYRTAIAIVLDVYY